MKAAPRMTLATQLVLEELLAGGASERYGYDVGVACGLASGTVHPILARLERAGWVTSRWEDDTERGPGRPARRYYQLTRAGAEAARTALAVRPRGARLGSVRPASRP